MIPCQLDDVIGQIYDVTNPRPDTQIQGVSENTDTFLSLPALVFITAQRSLGARIDP